MIGMTITGVFLSRFRYSRHCHFFFRFCETIIRGVLNVVFKSKKQLLTGYRMVP
jgi:hypothetical protein